MPVSRLSGQIIESPASAAQQRQTLFHLLSSEVTRLMITRAIHAIRALKKTANDYRIEAVTQKIPLLEAQAHALREYNNLREHSLFSSYTIAEFFDECVQTIKSAALRLNSEEITDANRYTSLVIFADKTRRRSSDTAAKENADKNDQMHKIYAVVNKTIKWLRNEMKGVYGPYRILKNRLSFIQAENRCLKAFLDAKHIPSYGLEALINNMARHLDYIVEELNKMDGLKQALPAKLSPENLIITSPDPAGAPIISPPLARAEIKPVPVQKKAKPPKPKKVSVKKPQPAASPPREVKVEVKAQTAVEPVLPVLERVKAVEIYKHTPLKNLRKLYDEALEILRWAEVLNTPEPAPEAMEQEAIVLLSNLIRQEGKFGNENPISNYDYNLGKHPEMAHSITPTGLGESKLTGRMVFLYATAYRKASDTAILVVHAAEVPWVAGQAEFAIAEGKEALETFLRKLWLYVYCLRRNHPKNLEIRIICNRKSINQNLIVMLQKINIQGNLTVFHHKRCTSSHPEKIFDLKALLPSAPEKLDENFPLERPNEGIEDWIVKRYLPRSNQKGQPNYPAMLKRGIKIHEFPTTSILRIFTNLKTDLKNIRLVASSSDQKEIDSLSKWIHDFAPVKTTDLMPSEEDFEDLYEIAHQARDYIYRYREPLHKKGLLKGYY